MAGFFYSKPAVLVAWPSIYTSNGHKVADGDRTASVRRWTVARDTLCFYRLRAASSLYTPHSWKSDQQMIHCIHSTLKTNFARLASLLNNHK